MSLVVLERIGQQVLVAEAQVVDERNAGNPVSVFFFAVTLYIVLASGKVPHEVAPVHEVKLIRHEELEILPLCRHLDRRNAACGVVVRHFAAFNPAHPAFVSVAVVGRMHTREKHVLRVNVFVVVAHYDVGVFLALVVFFLAVVDSLALVALPVEHTVASRLELGLRCVGVAVEQGARTVLLAVKVRAEGEDVLGRVLVHGRIGRGADYYYRIGGVTNHKHEEAEQRGVHYARRNEEAVLLVPFAQNDEQCRKHYNAEDNARSARTVERYSEKTYGKHR